MITLAPERHGKNPLRDAGLLLSYLRLLRAEKPDVVLTFNIKPNIYGGLACRLRNVPYLVNVTGLGVAVEVPGRLQTLTTWLYARGVKRAACVLFQNAENEQFFRRRGMLLNRTPSRLLPGSGVNLERFLPLPYPSGEVTRFLLVARIMQEKGIDLYLNAARRIRQHARNTEFHICGACDAPEYAAILRAEAKAGTILYHGEQPDMRPFFQMAHCVVHPSYYPEGMSNVLLEAAASARPIVATDRSGCREVVADGRSGFLIPVRNEDALTQTLEHFLALSREEQQRMGLEGRAKVEREFDRAIVVDAYRQEIARALKHGCAL
jgi:galacturonosyltransferase